MATNESPACGERAFKSFVDRTTMYRLMLYYLLALFTVAVFFGVTNILPYEPYDLLSSALILVVVSLASNKLFSWIFGVVANRESVIITALILSLIFTPVAVTDIYGVVILAIVAVLANLSKYVLTFKKKHIFNPVAIAAVLLSFIFGMPVTWWAAGNVALLPFIVVGGLIIVYKLKRFDLILAFVTSAVIVVVITSNSPIVGIYATLLYSIFFFFAFVMLTEPMTTPNTRILRIIYGTLVGVLFILAPNIGPFHISPELALIIGNIFSFLVNPKGRYALTLVERRSLADGIYEYLFKKDKILRFKPGQYMEWTLGDVQLDDRGNRRFFTIVSDQEKDIIAFATRLHDKPSAFKRSLSELKIGGVIYASSLGGEFIMPKDTKRKLAFLAGGVGVTPFVSMARYCIKENEKRDTILLYSNKTESEIAYKDIFRSATGVGWRTAYRIGFIDATFIKNEIPDYSERLFYISGQPQMVDSMKRILIKLGISRFNIKTDFFPGLA